VRERSAEERTVKDRATLVKERRSNKKRKKLSWHVTEVGTGIDRRRRGSAEGGRGRKVMHREGIGKEAANGV